MCSCARVPKITLCPRDDLMTHKYRGIITSIHLQLTFILCRGTLLAYMIFVHWDYKALVPDRECKRQKPSSAGQGRE